MSDELSGAELIAAERQRQLEKEGWTPEHDSTHDDGSLVVAAICYARIRCSHPAIKTSVSPSWPWELEGWKPSSDQIRNLVKAGALIAAEIDRLRKATGDE
jgi:hypothetical protein